MTGHIGAKISIVGRNVADPDLIAHRCSPTAEMDRFNGKPQDGAGGTPLELAKQQGW